MELIDPTADVQAARPTAPRRKLAGNARIGLVDAMLNARSGLGNALLDAVRTALGDDVGYGRERRLPEGEHRPMRWAAAMAARYRALVIAAGD